MNSYRKHLALFGLLLASLVAMAQKPSMGIIEIKAKGVSIDNQAATSIVRFEVEKLQRYTLMDAEEMKYKFVMKQHVTDDCFNQMCLVASGKVLGVDKMLSGSVEQFGDNILVTVKIYDVAGNKLEMSKKIEVIRSEDQTINEVISAAMKEAQQNQNDFITIDIREKKEETPVVKEEPKKEPEKTDELTAEEKLKAYTEDEETQVNKRVKESRFPKLVVYTRPSTLLEIFTKVQLGAQYSLDDVLALKGSAGYIFASNRDNLWTINGPEPGIKGGFETRGELILRFPKYYYETDETYSRYYFSLEGMYQRKYHRPYTTSEYDYNLDATLTYESDGFASRVVSGNLKFGGQLVFSNLVYLDAYMGVGLRSHYYDRETQDFYGGFGGIYGPYQLQNRILPNMVAGLDFGVLIK